MQTILMHLKFSLLFTVLFSIASSAQQITFVADSIMDSYMKNGYANKHFMPKGKEDAAGRRQGKWKDYEVAHDFTYLFIENTPEQLEGDYLLYGEGSFFQDKREGIWKFYVIEDKTFKRILQKEISFSSGEPIGFYKYYYPNGKVSQTGAFDESRITELNVYYPNGKLYRSRQVLDGMSNGKSFTFYPDGKVLCECQFVEDSLDGPYISYYPNGNQEEVSFFKNGSSDGTYRYFHANGQLWIEKEYTHGLLMNIKCNYDESGKSRDFGTLKNGNGTVKYYTRTGDVYSIQTFKDGVKISEESNSEFDR